MEEKNKMLFNQNDPDFSANPRFAKSQEFGGVPPSKLVKLVIKISGGSINEKQAVYVLVGLAVIMFAVSIIFFRRAIL